MLCIEIPIEEPLGSVEIAGSPEFDVIRHQACGVHSREVGVPGHDASDGGIVAGELDKTQVRFTDLLVAAIDRPGLPDVFIDRMNIDDRTFEADLLQSKLFGDLLRCHPIEVWAHQRRCRSR